MNPNCFRSLFCLLSGFLLLGCGTDDRLICYKISGSFEANSVSYLSESGTQHDTPGLPWTRCVTLSEGATAELHAACFKPEFGLDDNRPNACEIKAASIESPHGVLISVKNSDPFPTVNLNYTIRY